MTYNQTPRKPLRKGQRQLERYGTANTETREYRAWINMRSRCKTPSANGYHRYGGRGITVCERWDNSFEAFIEDMGPRPSPKHSVDRIDVNGNYEPGNCRWATKQEQARNLTNNRIVTINGRRMTLAEAVEGAAVIYNTVLYRLRRGWKIEDALYRPQQRGIRP